MTWKRQRELDARRPTRDIDFAVRVFAMQDLPGAI
jgi:hypothetical protein